MDYVSNEHPTGGFFGGGYEGAFQAIRLDSDKNQATGSPLGSITKLQSNRSTSDFDKVANRASKFLLRDLACKWLSEKEVRITKKSPDVMIPSFIGLITAQNVVLIKTRISLCITTKVGNKRILVIWCIVVAFGRVPIVLPR